MRVYPYGDGAHYVDLEADDATDRAPRTQRVARALAAHFPRAEVVVGAGNIALVGSCAKDAIEALALRALAQGSEAPALGRSYEIPVVYDGPDLDEVGRLSQLAPAEVARLHAAQTYTVELIGFLPGFAYMTELDRRIVAPRRASPRPRVARGSVAIAGSYTGVYPLASPGGWQLIGRVLGTELFDPQRDPPALLEPGDTVRFIPRHEG